jgi:hypothetical protein
MDGDTNPWMRKLLSPPFSGVLIEQRVGLGVQGFKIAASEKRALRQKRILMKEELL